MRWLLCLLSAVLLTVSGQLAVRAGDKAADYLKDGKLKERIEVHDVRLDGTDIENGPKYIHTIHVVEPDGSWSIVRKGGRVQELPNAKKSPTQGKLTAEQLSALAKDLARYDLANLPSRGAPTLGGRIEIHFGKKQSVLAVTRDKATTEKEKAIRARYDGITQAVRTLCQVPQLVPDQIPTVLEKAEQLEVYRLSPERLKENPKAGFQGWKVVGQTTVKDAAIRGKLLTAFKKGVAENKGEVADCFNPRHGIRATHDGKTYDLVICFECFQVRVFSGNKQAGEFLITNSPQAAFDSVLQEAKAPSQEK